MNVINFFQELSNRWNEINKCDYCWTFGAPLGEAGMNSSVSKDDEKCCVHLFVTYYKTSSGYSKNQKTGQSNREWCDHIFTLYAVKHSDISLNIYNEQPFHPIEESLWKTHLEPLQNCLGCGKELELCELGYNFEIFKWDMEIVKKYEDSNFTGWKINGIFRQYS